jgi:hypothetical protein
MLFYDQIIAGGALLGVVNAHHWAVALPISCALLSLAATVINRNQLPREILLEAIVRYVDERLLAIPPRSLESALRPRDQAWRRRA